MPFSKKTIDATDDFEKKLQAKLFRFDCPSPFTIGEYRFGLLDEEQGNRVAVHLKTCPYCRHEFEYLNEYVKITPDAVKPAPAEQQEQRIIPLVRNTVTRHRVEPVAAVRGEEDKEIKNGKITIHVDQQEAIDLLYTLRHEQDSYLLTGQFLPDESKEERLAHSLLELWQKDEIVASIGFDTLCSFRLNLQELSPALIRIIDEQGTYLSFPLEL